MTGHIFDGRSSGRDTRYDGLADVLPDGWPVSTYLDGDIRDTMAASDHLRGRYDTYDSTPDDPLVIEFIAGFQFLKGNAES